MWQRAGSERATGRGGAGASLCRERERERRRRARPSPMPCHVSRAPRRGGICPGASSRGRLWRGCRLAAPSAAPGSERRAEGVGRSGGSGASGGRRRLTVELSYFAGCRPWGRGPALDARLSLSCVCVCVSRTWQGWARLLRLLRGRHPREDKAQNTSRDISGPRGPGISIARSASPRRRDRCSPKFEA